MSEEFRIAVCFIGMCISSVMLVWELRKVITEPEIDTEREEF